MASIKEIINEEIMNTVANYPEFGDHLNLNEIGEATREPYPFNFDNVSYNEVEYHFETEDQDDYIVYIVNTDIQNGVWDMQFGISGGSPEDVVDKGRMYRVMATILKITNNFIDKLKPNIIKVKPAKNEGDDKDMRRHKLYMEYIKKNMRADYFAYEYNPYIIIERKAKISNNTPKI